MKSKWKILITLIFLLICGLSFIYTKSISEAAIVGEYVECWDDKNPNDTIQDTLKIFSDGNYRSKEWGNGTYRVEQGVFETWISLRPFEEDATGLSTYVTRSLFGKPVIWLADDFGWRFEKYR